MRIILAFSLLVVILTGSPDGAFAQTFPKARETYSYIGRERNLRDVLQIFARNTNVGISVDPNVRGEVVSLPQDLGRAEFLDYLALRYDFVWYFDGAMLHVLTRRNLVSETITLTNRTGAEVVRDLKSIGFWQRKFSFSAGRAVKAIFITGPEVYVEKIKVAVKALDEVEAVDLKLMRGDRSLSGASILSEQNSGANAPQAAAAFDPSRPLSPLLTEPMLQ